MNVRVFTFGGAMMMVSFAHASPQAFQDEVTASGPVLWYQMNEQTGNAVNHGSLGSSHDLVFQGSVGRDVSTYAGDSAVRFSDPNSYGESLGLSSLTGNPTFTCEAIVRLDQNGSAGNWGPFLHWGGGSTGTAVYFSVSSNDNTSVYTGFYNAGVRTSSVGGDRWVHVAWVREGGNSTSDGTTLYINGIAQTVVQDPALSPGFLNASSINVTSTPFTINRAANLFGTRFFTGEIDEVALYDRALTPAEIAAHVGASGLTCYADCDGVPVLNIFDYICFGNAYSTQDPYADCDGSGVLNIFDYICFGNAYSAGCP